MKLVLPAHRFSTDYSIWGVRLDVDRLLAEASPHRDYEVWRRGDPGPIVRECETSGITIELFRGWSEGDLHRAVRAFLRRDAQFLRAARRRTRGGTRSGLSTSVLVGAGEDIPAGLELPPSMLRLAAQAGVSWELQAWVDQPKDSRGERRRPTSA